LHEIEEIIAPTASTRSGGGGGVGSIDAKSAPAGFDNSGSDGDHGACRDNERKINPAFCASYWPKSLQLFGIMRIPALTISPPTRIWIAMSELSPTKSGTDAEREASVPRALSPAAQRALAEAQARRAELDRVAKERPKEFNGRRGPDPVRYGDWEVKGIACDFWR
jgi:hypothetical protein